MSFIRTSCGTRSPYRSPTPPSDCDSSRRSPSSSTHNPSLHCQPSEDEDFTVTDHLVPSAHTFHLHPTERLRQIAIPPASNNVALPYTYGDTLPKHGVMMSSGLSELNFHPNNGQLRTTEGKTNGKEDMLFENDQTYVKSRDPVCDWSSDEDVDSPGFGARPAGTDELTHLRHNYNRLLENHQRFVVSNAQLHDIREELLLRVAEQEMELNDARSMIRGLELDKQQLSEEVDSLQRALNILKDQMPLVAEGKDGGQPWQQTRNDKCNSADEWTSSLKEELRQTIMLAMTQQQQLSGLYMVIKQQNATIRRLTSVMTSKPKTSPQPPPFQDDFSGLRKQSSGARTLRELDLRQNPDGSSVSVQEMVKDQRSVDRDPRPPSPSEVRSGGVTVPLKDSFRKIFGGRVGTSPPKQKSPSTATTGIPLTQVKTVAKRQPVVTRQHSPGSGAVSRVKSGREGVSVCGPPNSSVPFSHVDLENAGFVFVDSSVSDSRICPLCGVGFSSDGTTMEQFVEHVSQCVPPAEHRQCPVCLQRFDKTMTERAIEMHVNEHFDEDRFQCLSPVENK